MCINYAQMARKELERIVVTNVTPTMKNQVANVAKNQGRTSSDYVKEIIFKSLQEVPQNMKEKDKG